MYSINPNLHVKKYVLIGLKKGLSKNKWFRYRLQFCFFSGLVIGWWWLKLQAAPPYPTQSWVTPPPRLGTEFSNWVEWFPIKLHYGTAAPFKIALWDMYVYSISIWVENLNDWFNKSIGFVERNVTCVNPLIWELIMWFVNIGSQKDTNARV